MKFGYLDKKKARRKINVDERSKRKTLAVVLRVPKWASVFSAAFDWALLEKCV